jgi:hypothetical protein
MLWDVYASNVVMCTVILFFVSLYVILIPQLHATLSWFSFSYCLVLEGL